MFHILGFLFIFVLAIIFIGLSIIGSVIRTIFGLGKHNTSKTYQNGSGSYRSSGGYSFSGDQQQDNTTEHSDSDAEPDSKHKKIFSEDEGEYVDYEEVKE